MKSNEEQDEILEQARAKTGRPTHLLEKDAWVVWALGALFESPRSPDACRTSTNRNGGCDFLPRQDRELSRKRRDHWLMRQTTRPHRRGRLIQGEQAPVAIKPCIQPHSRSVETTDRYDTGPL